MAMGRSIDEAAWEDRQAKGIADFIEDVVETVSYLKEMVELQETLEGANDYCPLAIVEEAVAQDRLIESPRDEKYDVKKEVKEELEMSSLEDPRKDGGADSERMVVMPFHLDEGDMQQRQQLQLEPPSDEKYVVTKEVKEELEMSSLEDPRKDGGADSERMIVMPFHLDEGDMQQMQQLQLEPPSMMERLREKICPDLIPEWEMQMVKVDEFERLWELKDYAKALPLAREMRAFLEANPRKGGMGSIRNLKMMEREAEKELKKEEERQKKTQKRKRAITGAPKTRGVKRRRY